MKKKSRVLVGAAVSVAVAGGGAAVAATQFDNPRRESQAVLNDAAKQLGVQPSELSAALKKALENRVDAAVAAGRLTKEQGDELKQRIAAGDLPLLAGPRPFGHDSGLFPPMARLDAAASYLGIEEQQLKQRLNAGQTLANVAKARGKSVDGLVSALVDAAKKELDEAVADGRLTKQRQQRLEQGLDARVRDFVQNAQLRIHDRHDDHGRPRFSRALESRIGL